MKSANCWTPRKVQCRHKEVHQRSQHFRCCSSKGSKIRGKKAYCPTGNSAMLELIPILDWHEKMVVFGGLYFFFFVEQKVFYRKFLSHVVMKNYKNNKL